MIKTEKPLTHIVRTLQIELKEKVWGSHSNLEKTADFIKDARPAWHDKPTLGHGRGQKIQSELSEKETKNTNRPPPKSRDVALKA